MDLESIQKLYKTNIYYNSDVNGNTTTEIVQNGTKKNSIHIQILELQQHIFLF